MWALNARPGKSVRDDEGTHFQFVGDHDQIGMMTRNALPGDATHSWFETLDHVYASDETFLGRQLQVALQNQPVVPVL